MYDNLTSLYKYADDNDIEVYYFPMRSERASAAFSDRTIIIDTDQLETSAEEVVHLAHELGHIETNSFYNVNSQFVLQEKMEHKADRWAINGLIPLHELKTALSDGLREKWELAERFNVTEDFIVKAIEHYKRKECL